MTKTKLHKSLLYAAFAALAAWALQATYAAHATANTNKARGPVVAALPPASYAGRAAVSAAASAPLIISELRVRGPNGANDEFIEIYNNSDAAVTVATTDNSSGFAVAASDGVARCVISNGTVIPARGHYLCVNSVGYSLASYPAGNGTTATGDSTYTTGIPDNAGVALFCTSTPANFTLANRLDAVGSTNEANTLYREGAGLPVITGFSIDYSFYRKLPGVAGTSSGTAAATSRFPQDTNDNAADFLFVDTNGTLAGAGQQRLGAPGPENLSSPVTTTANVTRTLLDSCVAAGAPPNKVRDYTSDPGNKSTFGTLSLRRTYTNNTGAPITRLRFRIQDLTTFPAPTSYADLRPRTSRAVVVTVDRPPCGSGTSNVNVQGTTLEQPPLQTIGGGFNSSLSAETVTLTNALALGASIDVELLFGIEQTGFYRLAVTVEALPGGGDLWLLCGNTENNSDVEGGCAAVAPTIAKSFNPTTINAGASSQLTLTFTNPSANVALSNLAATDNLPAGVTVAATPSLTNTCGGMVAGATAGSSSFSLSGGQLAAGANCQVQVNVTSSRPGMATNTTGNVTAASLGFIVMGETASAILTVNPIQAPTVSKAFSPTGIPSGGASAVTITLGNSNPSLALTDAVLTDTLPASLTTVAATAATTCGGTATQMPGSVSLSGGTIPAGGSCTLTVQVTGTMSGTFTNTIAAVDLKTTNGGANTVGTSAMLTVVAPPTLSKTFNPTTLSPGATTQLTLTFSNPTSNQALSNLAATDNLPAGVTIAATPGLTSTCGGMVAGATTGSSSFSLSGGTLAAGASCQVQVNVTSSTPGTVTNNTTAPTATGGGIPVTGTPARQMLTVNPIQAPIINKTFGAATIPLGGTTGLSFTINNPNPSLALTGAAFTDTLPGGLVVATPNGLTNSCGGAVTATPASGTISLSGGAVAAGGSCTIMANVMSTTLGAKENSVTVTSTNGGAGNTATATVTVTPVTSAPLVTIVDPFGCTGPGDVLTVTVTITNPALIAQPITFTTTLPAGLVGIPGTGTSTVGDLPTVTATGASFGPTVLAAGQSATVTYQVQVGDAMSGAQLCISTASTFSGADGPSVQACATVNCPAVGPGLPFPSTSEVSDQKAGSVLVYNLYSSSAASPNTQNTRLSITNTNPSLDIAVHLFFVDGQTCSIADATICLTQNQTASFLASDLDPGTTGYLAAVASDPTTGCPVSFNFLIGDAYIKLTSGHQANLGAEAFAALAGGPVACDANALTAQLNFDGVSYNRAPRTVAASSIPARNDGNDTLLVLNRFGGNLATGASTLTDLLGLFYDDAENGLSFTFSPGTCQFRSSLSGNFPRTTPRLETFIPAGRTGWLRLYSAGDIGLLGAVLNYNPTAGTAAGAFNQGRNLHKLTLTGTQTLVVPIFPPNCLD